MSKTTAWDVEQRMLKQFKETEMAEENMTDEEMMNWLADRTMVSIDHHIDNGNRWCILRYWNNATVKFIEIKRASLRACIHAAAA
jgi:hypothetical protein